MSSGPTAHGVYGVSAWSSRSIHIVHVVADQEHSNCAVPRYRYTKELVWIFVMPNAHMRTSTLKVLGHGHVFEVWILISSGSDIIILIQTRGFGVI